MSEKQEKEVTQQEKRKSQVALIEDKYAEFLPPGVDAVRVYNQWVKSIFGSAPPDDSIMYFILSQAKAAGIDPRVPRQIYAVPFTDWKTKETNWQVIIGIEGLVTIADNTGTYGGTTKPDYEFDDEGKPIACTIGVHKVVKGVPATSFQTVYFKEYDTGKNLWKTKPMTMLKKVAHAHALRGTFSACAGMYIEEEVQKGEFVDVESEPNIKEKIKEAKTPEELKKILDSLEVSEKRRVVELVTEKKKELDDGTRTGE